MQSQACLDSRGGDTGPHFSLSRVKESVVILKITILLIMNNGEVAHKEYIGQGVEKMGKGLISTISLIFISQANYLTCVNLSFLFYEKRLIITITVSEG